MYRVELRFYEELNDLLPRALRKRTFTATFPEKRPVRDLIESYNVPHTEVDLVLVNGDPVAFDHAVRDGDRIAVYPVFESLPVRDLSPLRKKPLRNPRFLCDVHLGTLARRLRLLGWDTVQPADGNDHTLVERAKAEGRILLTRDRQLLMHREVTRGILIRSTDPDAQVLQVLDRLDLRPECTPFSRCLACNGTLEALTPGAPEFEAVRDRIPAGVREWRREFRVCTGCGQVYWKGTHYERLAEKVRAYLAEPARTGYEGRTGGST